MIRNEGDRGRPPAHGVRGRPRILAAYLGFLAVVGLILYGIFVGGSWPGIYLSELRQGSLAVLTALFLVWGAAAVRAPRLRPSSLFATPIAVALGAMAISTFLSVRPRVSAEYLAWALVLVGSYLALVTVLRSPFVRIRIGMLCTVLAVLIGAVYLGIAVSDWIRWWSLVGGAATPPLRPGFEGLTLGNPSAVMSLEVLLTASAVADIGVATRRRRVASALLVLLAAVVTVLSGSRAGWLALAATLPILALGWAWTRRRDVRDALGRVMPRLARAGRVRRAIFVGAAVIVVGLAVAVSPAIATRVTAGGEALRLTYYVVSVRIAAEQPLTGTGPGTWVILRPSFTEPGEPDAYIPHAHDIYLQTAAELGIVGIVAGVFLAVVLFRGFRRAASHRDPGVRRWAWAAAFGVVYLALHQLLDFYANAPAILMALAIPVAYVDQALSTDGASGGRASALARLVFAAALVVSIAALWSWEVPASDGMAATSLLNEGDPEGALPYAKRAVDGDPTIGAFHLDYALALGWTGDLAGAGREFRTVAEADDLANAWLGAAAVDTARGDTARAEQEIDHALRLGWQQPTVALDAGILLERLGKSERAAHVMVNALAWIPALAGDPAWRDQRDLAPLWPRVFELATTTLPPELAWAVAIHGGDPALAKSILPRVSPESREVADLVIAAWSGGDDANAAYEALTGLARNRPLDPTVLGWCVKTAVHLGDDEGAARFKEWIVIVANGFTAAESDVRIDFAPPVGRSRQIVGSLAPYYGHYTYRRPTPWDVTPPGLPAIVSRTGD